MTKLRLCENTPGKDLHLDHSENSYGSVTKRHAPLRTGKDPYRHFSRNKIL